MRSPRRTFGPTLLLGLAGSGAMALAGARAWVEVEGGTSQSDQLIRYALADGGRLELPAGTSLALVALAAWGVVLVTRGRVRRVVGWLGLLASVGMLAAAVWGLLRLDDGLADEVGHLGSAPVAIQTTPWAWIGLLASIVALGAAAVGVRTMRSWPEMGSRYDAPTTAPASRPMPEASVEEPENIDLWKAIDAGLDPTLERPRPPLD